MVLSQAGEELETGNAYARSLIEDGFAEYIEQAELIEAPKKAKTTRAKKEKDGPELVRTERDSPELVRTERDSPAESVNPFVG